MSSIPFTIREARASDLDAMVGLLRQLFAVEDDFTYDAQKQRHGIAALMADHNRCTAIVAVVNDTVVGMCTAQITISTAEGGASALVEDLVVDGLVRRHGVGTALFAAIREWAVQHGCLRMQLLADHRNGTALAFYKQRGWRSTNMICLNYPMPRNDHPTSNGNAAAPFRKGEKHHASCS